MDFFARQRAVPDWELPLIAQQRALVLGIGGVGCSVARNLCRLGVSVLVLVDCDVVSPSNVNRQVLFSREDVGQRKVDAAVEGLARDNIQTAVSAVHCNAVSEWSKVITLARDSTVVFNCIDYGEYFDSAVTSLCLALSVPYVSASCYGHTSIAECYPPPDSPRNGPCWVCNNAPADTGALLAVTPDKILTLDSIAFLPKDTYMPSTQDVGSSVLPCMMGGALATGGWINTLHGYSLPNWTSCDIATFQLFSFTVEPNPSCLLCQNGPRYSKAVLNLHFGGSEVQLSVVPGQTLAHSPEGITNPATPAHLESARQHLQPCSDLGPDYANVYVPAIPAADLELSALSGDVSTLPDSLSGDVSTLPDLLCRPLLKSATGTVTAFRSGSRSAILPTTNACYRLKGCGNFVDADGLRYSFPGFPLEKLEAKEDGVEVRGCCFEHTALTEQYMSEVVGAVLARENIAVGNKPVAMWKYNIPGEPFPKLKKFCGVFETLGEKRLASHLLPGLEALLPLLFPSVSHDQVLALFPAERLSSSDSGNRGVQPTWSACCSSAKSSPINMCLCPLLETPPTHCPEGLPPSLLGVWCQAAYTLRESLPLSEDNTTACGSLMALLYWQLGREVGAVKRLLEEESINWGYFIDHNPFEPHCNAHPNNFVVLPSGGAKLLAPVDFDLAYVRKGFFSPYTGSYDDELFASWQGSEHTELERALGGERANTGVSMTELGPSSPSHTALSWAFRDTLLCGYRSSYHQGPREASHQQPDEDPHPIPSGLGKAVDRLVRMALVLTHSHTT